MKIYLVDFDYDKALTKINPLKEDFYYIQRGVVVAMSPEAAINWLHKCVNGEKAYAGPKDEFKMDFLSIQEDVLQNNNTVFLKDPQCYSVVEVGEAYPNKSGSRILSYFLAKSTVKDTEEMLDDIDFDKLIDDFTEKGDFYEEDNEHPED